MPIPVAIAIAGAAGALCRWSLTAAVQKFVPGVFPWGTLVVNVIGCFVLGFAATHFAVREDWSLALRTALISGFLGAFTTFSTFSFDTVELLRTGHAVKAVGNVALSVGIGLAAAALGIRVASRGL